VSGWAYVFDLRASEQTLTSTATFKLQDEYATTNSYQNLFRTSISLTSGHPVAKTLVEFLLFWVSDKRIILLQFKRWILRQ